MESPQTAAKSRFRTKPNSSTNRCSSHSFRKHFITHKLEQHPPLMVSELVGYLDKRALNSYV